MPSPSTRLPNCAASPCSDSGDGDRHINQAPDGIHVVPGESVSFWAHLAAADLITGVNPAKGLVWGGDFPAANIAGGFRVGYDPGGVALGGSVLGNNIKSGHYLALCKSPATAIGGGAGDTPLTESQAYNIDVKLDDGNPIAGNALAMSANGNCTVFVGNVWSYTNGLIF